jgi:hypothetical protein
LLPALAALALTAQAGEGLDLAARSKSSATIGARSASASAPFLVGASDASVEALLHFEPQAPALRSACDRATIDVCYDATDGRIVYKPARQYMPKLEGLTAESISVRHDRVVFKYSFK